MTWKGILLTWRARGSLFWCHGASDLAYMVPDDGKHAFSMIGVREMRQRSYGEGGLGGEGALRGLAG